MIPLVIAKDKMEQVRTVAGTEPLVVSDSVQIYESRYCYNRQLRSIMEGLKIHLHQ